MASNGDKSTQNGETDELSFASYSANSAANPLVAKADALLRTLQSERKLDQDGLEELIASIFVELRSSPSSQIAWAFPKKLDDYRPLHVLNAARMAMFFALESGMEDAHVVQLGIVALLYDVGIFDSELDFVLEPRKLSSVEFNMVEEISLRGADILESVEGIDPLCAIVAREHHERADGTGYPDRTKGEDQHPYSRLIQIIDSFLGMIEPRSFRDAITPIEAMQRLAVQAHRGYYYEAAFRDWLKVMGVFPVGSFITLNTGEVALIRASGGDKLRRPKIDVLTDEYLEFRLKPFEVDMAEERAFEIAGAFTKFPSL